MLRTTLFLYASFLMSTGCTIHGSLQGLHSYYDKTDKASPGLLQKTTQAVCNLPTSETPAVFVINGKQLQPCLQACDKALLYIWTPKCSSDRCIPLSTLQAYADKRHWELFIVAEYYDMPTMSKLYDIKRPIFGIDCEYYKTNLTEKYVSRFMKDVLEPGQDEGVKSDVFFLFEKGKLRAKSWRVNDIPDDFIR